MIDLFTARYGLVTEQKKGAYRYFANMGKSIEEAVAKTTYVDEVGP
jgi:ATP-dependent DNA helicase 2 subunit 1